LLALRASKINLMSQAPTAPRQVVGLIPWLPWPLSAWPWWTEPVRAERLALLRIGIALCLLADIALNYAPETFTYFGKGELGDPAIFHWRFQPPRMTWSLLRGVGDGVIVHLSLALWIMTTGWILGTTLARLLWIHKNPPANDRTGIATWLWTIAFLVYTAGLWSQMIDRAEIDFLAWVVPLAGFSLACLFFVLDLSTRLREETHHLPWLPLLGALATSLTLASIGYVLAQIEPIDKSTWFARLLRPWQEDNILLAVAMGLWIASACLLLLGFSTRLAAVLTWLLSMSFANANMYLDNAGDTVRLILLFYLMLCPCGAVWSIDALIQRAAALTPDPSPKGRGEKYIHPWPIRLIFVQMIFIYFVNGLFKLLGPTWQDGSALHYVLGDLAITRFSQVALPLPIELTRLLTWSVTAWEVTFPLMVPWKWPRRIALVFGIVFHLGIFATLELGGFVPYALCMYLPLVPWERKPPGVENGTV
jgi:hypothetical protein